MNLIFDHIIFSLQRAGGISVVWRELTERARQDKDLHIADITPGNRWFERYRDPLWHNEEKAVFHSSYFRIIDQPNIHNITTVHDLTYHYYRSGLAKHVHLWQEERALKKSEQVICVSEHTRKDLLSQYPWLDAKHVHVIYNGVNEAFQQIKCVNPTPFESRGYLLYVGNREAGYKNWESAVIASKEAGLPLVIAGKALTPTESTLLDTQLGNGHYHVKVYPTQDELVTLYNHAYCLLYPSSYEGFGLPVIEAQRTGCMVIGQHKSSVPEVMGDGGICIDAKEHKNEIGQEMGAVVREMLNGNIHTAELIQKGKTNSERFSWDKTYEQTKQVYQLAYNS